ncbi:MAG: lambda exonuclease family protein [Nitrososphaera sp.]
MILRTDPAWHNARLGCLTASRMCDAMDFQKKSGKPGAARERLLRDIVAERLTNIIVPHYVNSAMQWGLDHQSQAISEYEIETGNIAGPEGFMLHPCIESFGATPDGFVDGTGVLEVKCPTTQTFIEWVMSGEVPFEHHAQMAAQLLCSERKWADFFAFDPRMPYGKRCFYRRFAPTEEYLDAVKEAAIKFLEEADNVFERISSLK